MDPSQPLPAPPPLEADARGRVDALLALLERDPTAPTTVSDRATAERVHVADSLSGLVLGELAAAGSVCDLGSGAGFPGLVLAAALPECRFTLLESVGRKCNFIARAIATMGLSNAKVECARSEELAAAKATGREAFEVVTARAVARLSTLAELASPLLVGGGHLVAWKGRRDPDEEAECGRAGERIGVEFSRVIPVGPYAGSKHRHLYLLRKVGPTPAGLPRRPGMAKKRPFGA